MGEYSRKCSPLVFRPICLEFSNKCEISFFHEVEDSSFMCLSYRTALKILFGRNLLTRISSLKNSYICNEKFFNIEWSCFGLHFHSTDSHYFGARGIVINRILLPSPIKNFIKPIDEAYVPCRICMSVWKYNSK